MNVGNMCQRSVATVRESDELSEVARVMREKHVGYIVVVEPSVEESTLKPAGVITDRDIVVAVLARDADARTLRAGDIMSRLPVVVAEEQPIDAAVQEMRRVGVRRLPVIGRRGELVGVLSLDDVLDVIATQLQNIAGAIRNEQHLERAFRP